MGSGAEIPHLTLFLRVGAVKEVSGAENIVVFEYGMCRSCTVGTPPSQDYDPGHHATMCNEWYKQHISGVLICYIMKIPASFVSWYV